jgi:hypothetical protein
MVERVKPDQPESPEAHREAEPVSDVTRWALMSEIRFCFRRDSRPIVFEEGGRIEYSETDGGDGKLTLDEFPDLEPTQLMLKDVGGGVEFREVSKADPKGMPLSEGRAGKILAIMKAATREPR